MKCPNCNKQMVVYYIDDKKHEECENKPCKVKELVASSGIQKFFLRNNFKVQHKLLKPYYEKLDWIDKGESILLLGNPGTMKTGQATAIGKKAISELKSVLYFNTRNIVFTKDDDYLNVDLVIADNVGNTPEFEEKNGSLFAMFDHRLHNYLSIIAITNEPIGVYRCEALNDRFKKFDLWIKFEGKSVR